VDDKLKRLVEELGTAINASLGESEQIAEVIAEIKRGGYDVFLVLNATIVVKKREREPITLPARTGSTIEARFNREDINFLKSMHICVNR
jgi:hypothetical protein